LGRSDENRGKYDRRITYAGTAHTDHEAAAPRRENGRGLEPIERDF